ncbi:DUF3734 domain-containing protein [Granulosicoccus antarcticus]|uniref:PNPLA domain-containing protein n=1 Tax=Granulosicoccus antarcticus IMCC3135 TaxID=1192854 RepID=A0A2Z2P093_9GAMM|nr:patatin-like phospholipase family protein [Granulosicoccus antarcticus]ASJ75671.1 hypothetical protein IMCC3135_28095 [Granulosicoccus antarcticus IMCC3135]
MPNPQTIKNEQSVLVLQGGGALGAYQAGAYECLAGNMGGVDWVAGISIGSINAAIIAGNTPDLRLARLRQFWERVTSGKVTTSMFNSGWISALVNEASAAATTLTGVPGFFDLRFPPASVMPPGTPGAISFYDTSALRNTLQELIDFRLINEGDVRLSVGAVNVTTGNMTWFDSNLCCIGPEHIMASAALPPGFPAIEINGEHYWDGGLVSNTPLQYVLDTPDIQDDLCIFQIDLFNARGALPNSVWQVEAREKEIRFSSRTRLNTDMMQRLQLERDALRRLYDKLPTELRNDPETEALLSSNRNPRITIAHLIYRQSRYERGSRDYEFSRSSMENHWAAGHTDAQKTLNNPAWKRRQASHDRVQVYDLSAA